MEDPGIDDPLDQYLRECDRAGRNAQRFLIALARFIEVYESQEEQQIESNPWVLGQVWEN